MHEDLIALDRAHQAVMRELVQEHAAAFDVSRTKEESQAMLAEVECKLEAHQLEFAAAWARVEARIAAQKRRS